MKTVMIGMAAAATLAMALTACHGEKKSTPQPDVRVTTYVVGESATSPSQSYSGTVEESTGSAISFSVPGTVQTMNVSEGDFVKKGQLIATLDATSLRNAYDISKAALDQAQDAYNRMKMLHDANALADIKWVEVQQALKAAQSSEAIARKTLSDGNLYAPISGYVSQKFIDAGMTAAPGLPVVKIVDIDPVQVSISIPENAISKIPEQGATQITVDALGGKTFTGHLSQRAVSANPITRSYDVKMTVDNPKGELLPGMICSVILPADSTAAPSIVVPSAAVLLDADNSNFVWLDSAGVAVKRNVDVASLSDNGIVIAAGLAPGDSVIIDGQQKVSRGSRVVAVK